MTDQRGQALRSHIVPMDVARAGDDLLPHGSSSDDYTTTHQQPRTTMFPRRNDRPSERSPVRIPRRSAELDVWVREGFEPPGVFVVFLRP